MTPPARYVMDCSITMAWFFEDESTPSTDILYDALPDSEVDVASIWPIEVANVLTLADRKGRTTDQKIGQFIERLNKQPIKVDIDGIGRAFTQISQLARQYKLTTYDASYLELTIRLNRPLATLNTDLRKAAKLAKVDLIDVGSHRK